MVMEMSKTYQYRKVMKPLLERKRRARINKCLDHLKDLMVECLQQDGEHVTRLEKADILELTVEHMRKLKQRGSLSLGPPATLQLESFRSGYVHAADQISQVLLQQRHPAEIGQKVIAFLSTRLMELQNQILTAVPSTAPTATAAAAAAPTFQFLPSSVLASSAFDNHKILRRLETQPYTPDLSDCSSDGSDCKSKTYQMNDDNDDGDEDDDDDDDVEISVTNEDTQPQFNPSTSSSVHADVSSEPMWRPW